MIVTATCCALLIALSTMIHYEFLGSLNARLPTLKIPSRSKLIVVIFTAFTAHAIEIGVYGTALFLLAKYMDVGTLSGPIGMSLASCFYFSAETFTSLGFGDLTPTGPVRLLAGVEALNGLLLVGWSASYTYIAMERFWNSGREHVPAMSKKRDWPVGISGADRPDRMPTVEGDADTETKPATARRAPSSH